MEPARTVVIVVPARDEAPRIGPTVAALRGLDRKLQESGLRCAGLVVLASPAEGCREALGDTAVYFPSLAPEAMAGTLRTVLCEEASALDDAAERGRRRVRDGFSVAAMADR